MDEFFEEMQRLRDAVEDKRVYDTAATDDWNTLTSSMDALEDTHHAIVAFVAAASKLEPSNTPVTSAEVAHRQRVMGIGRGQRLVSCECCLKVRQCLRWKPFLGSG